MKRKNQERKGEIKEAEVAIIDGECLVMEMDPQHRHKLQFQVKEIMLTIVPKLSREYC